MSNKKYNCTICQAAIDDNKSLAESGRCMPCKLLDHSAPASNKIKPKPNKHKLQKSHHKYAYQRANEIRLKRMDENDLEFKIMRMAENQGLIDLSKDTGNRKRQRVIKLILERVVRAYENKNGIIYVPQELRSNNQRVL